MALEQRSIILEGEMVRAPEDDPYTLAQQRKPGAGELSACWADLTLKDAARALSTLRARRSEINKT